MLLFADVCEHMFFPKIITCVIYTFLFVPKILGTVKLYHKIVANASDPSNNGLFSMSHFLEAFMHFVSRLPEKKISGLALSSAQVLCVCVMPLKMRTSSRHK